MLCLMSNGEHDDYSDDFDPRDPYGYGAEDDQALCEGPLPDDSEEEPSPAEHPERCGCWECDPDDARDRMMELGLARAA